MQYFPIDTSATEKFDYFRMCAVKKNEKKYNVIQLYSIYRTLAVCLGLL